MKIVYYSSEEGNKKFNHYHHLIDYNHFIPINQKHFSYLHRSSGSTYPLMLPKGLFCLATK